MKGIEPLQNNQRSITWDNKVCFHLKGNSCQQLQECGYLAVMENEMISAGLKATRPEPVIPGVEVVSFGQGNDIQEAIAALYAGRYVLIEDLFSTGLELLNDLQSNLNHKHPNKSYQEQREFRSEYRKLSNLILLRVIDHKLSVKKAPQIGWLEKLYPEQIDFHLPFPQVQGLNSAWQWYVNGIVIPGIRNRVHPYYGVYFPTRFEHLSLFDNWLKRYEGPKKSAIDVGIGVGILSLLLLKYGFQKSFGTDINPNAIIGLRESMEGTKLARKIEVDFGHLFGKWEKQTELIVFNPPWLPSSHDLDRLDEAIYYNDKLFPEFFEGAKKRLLPEGRVIILFSNLGQITNVTKEHPIEYELHNGDRFVLKKFLKKSVKSASELTKRNQHWRSSEEVELWVLKHK